MQLYCGEPVFPMRRMRYCSAARMHLSGSSCYFANEMRDDLNNNSEGAEGVSLRGLDAYGPFTRYPAAGGVNRFSFVANDKHTGGQENVARAILAAFAQAAMESSATGESH